MNCKRKIYAGALQERFLSPPLSFFVEGLKIEVVMYEKYEKHSHFLHGTLRFYLDAPCFYRRVSCFYHRARRFYHRARRFYLGARRYTVARRDKSAARRGKSDAHRDKSVARRGKSEAHRAKSANVLGVIITSEKKIISDQQFFAPYRCDSNGRFFQLHPSCFKIIAV